VKPNIFKSTILCLLLSTQSVWADSLSAPMPVPNENKPLIAQANSTAVGLTPAGTEAANLMGILPDLERLIEISRSRSLSQSPGDMNDQELALKVRVLDRVMGESLEVRMVSDRIDRELSWAFSGKGGIDAKRQRNLNYLFAANFMQGGVLATVSGPVILHGDHRANAELLLVASSIGLILSSLSFAEARRGSKPMDGETTVLADVFSLPQPDEKDRPELIYKFLNSVPPGSITNKTRLETLMDNWKKGHYLHSSNEKDLEKLAALQPNGEKFRETSALLGNRIRMLFDTQYTVEQLDQGLLDILRSCQH
jgi:hypothetical protein